MQRLAAAFSQSGGDLPTLYAALIDAPEAWQPVASKLKSPEEFVVSAARLLHQSDRQNERQNERQVDRVLARVAVAGIGSMGQRMHAAPSPAGWPDRAEEWLGPEALWQRVEWASRVAERIGPMTDARQLAQASLGERLSAATKQQIDRAADPSQALALLLMSPEFQRR